MGKLFDITIAAFLSASDRAEAQPARGKIIIDTFLQFTMKWVTAR